MHWALGVFHKRSETDDPVSEQSLAARLWFEPLHAANQSLSFNIAVNQWRPVDNHIAYSAGPESNLIAPLFIVDQTEVDSVNTLGISAESFVEQLTVAAEFNSSAFSVDGSANSTTQVKSVGAQSLTLGWFFTGDKRQRRNGAIQPVQPIHPWGARGWGALEASIRYSRLFDDQNQKLKDISFGLNWYLNRHFVAKANWISAAYSSQDQSLDAVITEVRLQVSY
jgi:phosphate-selective porin